MTFKFFMDEIMKSTLDFIKKQGFGTAVIVVVAVLFYRRAESYEARFDLKTAQITTEFKEQIKEIETSLSACDEERQKLALTVAKLESSFLSKKNKK